MSERVLSGAPASPGLAIGHARVLSHPSEDPARDPVPRREAAAEAEHAREALRQAAAELDGIAAALREDGRPDDAEIVETGALMAADPLLEAAVSEAVTERGRPRGCAWRRQRRSTPLIIESLPDALLAARADDVRSLGRRAARIAAGGRRRGPMARRSSSLRRTWGRPTWRSTATSSRGSRSPAAE